MPRDVSVSGEGVCWSPAGDLGMAGRAEHKEAPLLSPPQRVGRKQSEGNIKYLVEKRASIFYNKKIFKGRRRQLAKPVGIKGKGKVGGTRYNCAWPRCSPESHRPLSLWSAQTHYLWTRSRCDVRVITSLSPGFPKHHLSISPKGRMNSWVY